MVIQLAPVGRAVVVVEAADPAAVEIAQPAGIGDGLAQRGHIGLHPNGIASRARTRARPSRHDRIEEAAPKSRAIALCGISL